MTTPVKKQKRVLFVDDDVLLLKLVGELIGTYAGEAWEVLTAPDTAAALAIMREQVVDLVVTDVHMPVVDGLQFLKLLQRKYPNLLKVVLTGDTTGAYRAACLSSGAELYLEKPRVMDGWRVIYATLNELIKFQPEEGFRGVLRRVGIQEVIQLECLANKSSVLEVKAGSMDGFIYIRDGRIIHSECGTRSGEEAFYYIVSRPGGEFVLKPFVEPAAETINESWEGLLMEAAQKFDEYGPSAEPGPAIAAEESSDTALLMRLAAEGEQTVAPVKESAEARREKRIDLTKRPRVEEFLVCSGHGEVLHEWQCVNSNARILFLEFLSQKTRQLAQGLPIGFFDRLEIVDGERRIVCRVAADRAIFLDTARGAPPPKPNYIPTPKRPEP